MENISGKQFGPYRIVEPLGEGGMAAVYKAYQPGIDRYVAIKVLPKNLANDPQFLARFDREAKVLAKLQHPHILPIHDYGQAESYTYIVMPLVKSGTMTDILNGEPLPLPQIQKMMAQIGDALDYAHAQGIVHRDIKPSNVLIDERGNCLLTDFGIAKLVESEADLTGTGGIIGTPSYMSPEQAKGLKLDGRSDIYSLGIILYEMAVGRVPFKAETPQAVNVKHQYDPLPLPHTLNPNLPENVERVILKALAKEPDDRYPTTTAMVEALEAAIKTAPPAPDPAATVIAQAETPSKPPPRPAAPCSCLCVGAAGPDPFKTPCRGFFCGGRSTIVAVMVLIGLGGVGPCAPLRLNPRRNQRGPPSPAPPRPPPRETVADTPTAPPLAAAALATAPANKSADTLPVNTATPAPPPTRHPGLADR